MPDNWKRGIKPTEKWKVKPTQGITQKFNLAGYARRDKIPTAQEWHSWTSSAEARDIERVIAKYYNTPRGLNDQRNRLLGFVLNLSYAGVKKGIHFIDFGAFLHLYSTVITLLPRERLKRAVRTIIQSNIATPGRRMLHSTPYHYDFPAGPESNYWLEAIDPLHRNWGHSGEAQNLWQQWMNSGFKLNFFDWLEVTGYGQTIENVTYLAPDNRWRYMVQFKKVGEVYPTMKHVPGKFAVLPNQSKQLQALDTRHFWGKSHRMGRAAYVIDASGRLYVGCHEAGTFHHSSFLAGGAVTAAGILMAVSGRITWIDNNTGHYRCSVQDVYEGVKALAGQGADLSDAVCCAYDLVPPKKPGDPPTVANVYLVFGQDWLDNNGDLTTTPTLYDYGWTSLAEVEQDRMGLYNKVGCTIPAGEVPPLII